MSMNITDVDGLWRITDGMIQNRKTGEVRALEHTPSASALAHMPYREFMRKCAQAFKMGTWPQTHWTSGRVTD